MSPFHDIWERSRRPYHGGATRQYAKPSSPRYGRTSPLYCEHCTRAEEEEEEDEEEGFKGWEDDAEIGLPLPKFDLLDEIDFSAVAAKGGWLNIMNSVPATPCTTPTTLHRAG